MIEITCPKCGKIFWYNGTRDNTICPHPKCGVKISVNESISKSRARVIRTDKKV